MEALVADFCACDVLMKPCCFRSTCRVSPTIIVDMSSNGPAYNVAAGNELYIHYGKFWGERDYEVSMDPAPHGTLGSDDYLPAMQKVCRN